MRKVLVFSLMTLLASVSANVWGATYNYTKGNVTITLNTSTNTLTISPIANTDGKMSDLTETKSDWRTDANDNYVVNVIIEDGVTYIGQYAFYECEYMTNITIPTSVTGFGEGAFKSCANQKVYYAGTPNQWANIDFEVTGTYAYSHPFYGGTNNEHYYYFYGQKTTETKVIVFHEGLTTIKPYTFYNAGRLTDIYIPHSVTSIGTKAFYYCASVTGVAILNTSAPTAASDAFDHVGNTACLYVPSGANGSTSSPGFKRLPWYDSTNSRKGPVNIGYTSTDKSYTTTGNNFGTGKVYPLSGSVDGIEWTLSLNGTLTLRGSGAITTDFSTTSVSNTNIEPWWRFRRLVNKVVIEADGGDITALNNVLLYCYAIDAFVIDQATIPTATYSIVSNFKKSTDKVTLLINTASLTSSSASNLGSAPWNSAKLIVSLSDEVNIDQDEDNTTLLNNIRSYVDEPFDMQLTRSLTNASYNTFCSPVPMSACEVSSIFGGAEIYELSNSSIEGNELTLTFADSRSDIEAGVPYLFKPTNTTANPTIENVDPASVVSTATSTSTEHLTFYGTLAPEAVSSAQIDDKSFIFLQAADQLTWANGGTIKGMRAYWLLDGSVPAPALLNRPILRIGNSTTGIETVNDVQTKMDGQKILRNGQLIIVRDGVEYNALGQIVK